MLIRQSLKTETVQIDAPSYYVSNATILSRINNAYLALSFCVLFISSFISTDPFSSRIDLSQFRNGLERSAVASWAAFANLALVILAGSNSCRFYSVQTSDMRLEAKDLEWRGVGPSLPHGSDEWYSDACMQGHRGQCSQLPISHLHRVMFQPPPYSIAMEDLLGFQGAVHSFSLIIYGPESNIPRIGIAVGPGRRQCLSYPLG